MTEKEPIQDEPAARRERLEKAIRLGIDPYPDHVDRTHTIAELKDKQPSEPVTIVGRIMSLRPHGGSTFLHIEDGTGQFQAYAKKDHMGDEAYVQFKDLIDVGDFVEMTGTLFVTKRGEQTLDASAWRLVTKTLLPLPEKWHGLQDTEIRFRKRHLDLLMNRDVRERMVARSAIIDSIRATMKKYDFLEVETPTLQPIYGGGFARPFKTHHNTLDADFYLRISDEMYLKRLLVGGMERVYEITKVFRNEGIDRDHNPEFTMFEAQAAYQDYNWGMDLFEELFENAARDVLGKTTIQHGDVAIDLKRPWKRMRLVDAVATIGKLDVSSWKTIDQAKKAVSKKMESSSKTKELDTITTIGEAIAFAFEELVEEKLIDPTIIYDYPVEVSPLAKKCKDPNFTKRFESFALGSEIGNNYSELNDPVDLEQRFIAEKKRADAGFHEAHQADMDYVEAIKHGMPPACGFGIGVDRMIMLLTGASHIKEVILFPTLRPKQYV